MTLTVAILALVTIQRLGELWMSNRNTRALLARGAAEHAPGHYPWIVAIHFVWLTALWFFGLNRPVDGFWLAMYVLVETARIWVLASLGARWTTRIIVLPDAPLVRRGPYRLVNHPNYVVVVLEIAVLPLVFGLWQITLIFTVINAVGLAVRIRDENRALRG